MNQNLNPQHTCVAVKRRGGYDHVFLCPEAGGAASHPSGNSTDSTKDDFSTSE